MNLKNKIKIIKESYFTQHMRFGFLKNQMANESKNDNEIFYIIHYWQFKFNDYKKKEFNKIIKNITEKQKNKLKYFLELFFWFEKNFSENTKELLEYVREKNGIR